MKIKEIVDYGIEQLKQQNIEDYNIKAKVLLAHIIKQDKSYLTINCNEQLEPEVIIEYKKGIDDLINGKPLQYITKHQEFMNLNFYVDENVLIPQPDTEILVEETIKEINRLLNKSNKREKCTIRILDLCTGSGAIAISIAKYLQENKFEMIKKESTIDEKLQFEIYASDISKKALKIAEKNAKLNGVQIKFILSNMFENISKHINEKFEIIVSNPPYIRKNEIKNLPKDVQNEPHIALDGGEDGLYFYKIIAKNLDQFLKKEGTVFLEIGYNQKQEVESLFKDYKVRIIKDLAGNDRVVIL